MAKSFSEQLYVKLLKEFYTEFSVPLYKNEPLPTYLQNPSKNIWYKELETFERLLKNVNSEQIHGNYDN